MKAIELLEAAECPGNLAKAILLYGDDSTYQSILSLKLAAWMVKDDREDHRATTVAEVTRIIDQGSLYGSRLVIIEAEAPSARKEFSWQPSANFLTILKELRQTEDQVILRAQECPSYSNMCQGLMDLIEVKKPTYKKTREKIIQARVAAKKLKITADALKKLVDQTDDLASIEIPLNVMFLCLEEGQEIGVRDLEKVLREPVLKRDITRALLRHNPIRLAKEVKDSTEPILLLTILQSNLLKLYCWVEMVQAKIAVEKIATQLQIPQRFLRDWKLAVKYYSAQAIRQVMEVVECAFLMEISGNSDWRDKLQQALRQLE